MKNTDDDVMDLIDRTGSAIMTARRIADEINRGSTRVGIKAARALAKGFALRDTQAAEHVRENQTLRAALAKLGIGGAMTKREPIDRKNEPVTVDKVSGRGPRTAKAAHIVMGNNSLRCLHCGNELALPMPMSMSINVLIGMGDGYTKDHIDCKPSDAGEARYQFKTAEEWRRGWDTGASSIAIYNTMTSTYLHNPAIPYDPDDFGRCYRLLKLMPEWRARLHEMNRYPEWVPLIANWPELEALYEEELPNRTAPKLYDRMSELLGVGQHSKCGARISNP